MANFGNYGKFTAVQPTRDRLNTSFPNHSLFEVLAKKFSFAAKSQFMEVSFCMYFCPRKGHCFIYRKTAGTNSKCQMTLLCRRKQKCFVTYFEAFIFQLQITSKKKIIFELGSLNINLTRVKLIHKIFFH